MRLPFGKVIRFAHTRPEEVERAGNQFFKGLPPENEDDALPLFWEWLIYDYARGEKASFLVEYCLKNPDNLPEETLVKLRQAAETNLYSIFEITEVVKSEYVLLSDLFTGENYRVFDKSSTPTLPDYGTLHARIANVGGRWQFTGANPIYTPITYTDRARQTYKKIKTKFTPKDTYEIVYANKPKPEKPQALTPKELKNKHKELKRKYEKLSKRYANKFSFEKLLEEIYNENDTTLDFWERLTKKGLGKEFYVNNLPLLTEIWNHFPHKCLDDKSPVEMISEEKE